jgi:membrane associated rhomboid family serine protease
MRAALLLLPVAAAFSSPARAACMPLSLQVRNFKSGTLETRVLLSDAERRGLPETQRSGGGGLGKLPPASWSSGRDGDGDDSSEGNAFDALRAAGMLGAAAVAGTSALDAAGALPVAQQVRGGALVDKRRKQRPEISVTVALLALNAGAFGLQWLFPSLTFRGAKLTQRIVNHGEWYRLLTPIFLHGGLAHLLINSVSLYNLGPFVESKFGSKRMLSYYLLSGIAGNALSAVVNPRTPAVGASGAIAGLIGAAGCYFAGTTRQLHMHV